MSHPPATVVIPLRSQVDAWLEQSVRSALEQTAPAEVLVVTAADTPPSNRAVLERLAVEAGERLRIVDESRKGFAAGVNEGFESARAERVGLLFSDDWLDPMAVELALAVDADIVSGGKRIWSDDGERPLECVWEAVGSPAELDRCPNIEARARYITHFLLFSRRLVIRAGGVDESLGGLSGVDDYELIWTLLEHGASVGFTDRAVYNVRDHRGLRLTLRSAQEHLVSLRLILAKHGLDEAAQAEVIPLHMRWFGRRITEVLAERLNDA